MYYLIAIVLLAIALLTILAIVKPLRKRRTDPLLNGLKGWWIATPQERALNFDGEKDFIMLDKSGNGNHGVFVNMVLPQNKSEKPVWPECGSVVPFEHCVPMKRIVE